MNSEDKFALYVCGGVLALALLYQIALFIWKNYL